MTPTIARRACFRERPGPRIPSARAVWLAVAALAAVGAAAAGCSRGPDPGALRTEVQRKLDQGFKPGLFEVAGLKRQGSAPLPASRGGRQAAGRLLQRHAQAEGRIRLRQLGRAQPGQPGPRPRRDGERPDRPEVRREPLRRGRASVRQLHVRMVGRSVAQRRGDDEGSGRGGGAGERRPVLAVQAAHRQARCARRDPAARPPAGRRSGDLGGARARAADDHGAA